MSTLSQFTETSDDEHQLAKHRIYMALTNDARGPENAISSAELAARTPVSASTVRDLVPLVMAEYGIPVGTSNGYFVIGDKGEAARQIERQVRQAETSRERARLIGSTFYGNGEVDT